MVSMRNVTFPAPSRTSAPNNYIPVASSYDNFLQFALGAITISFTSEDGCEYRMSVDYRKYNKIQSYEIVSGVESMTQRTNEMPYGSNTDLTKTKATQNMH